MARKSGRYVDGILLLDKPSGMTSNRALRRVSRCLDARKAGHTGSLDPLATGLLVLCFGEATKVSGWLLDADKQYLTTARLGVTTDSADADGTVVEARRVPDLDDPELESVLACFRGEIEQVPPMFSALKHQGRRLHELAREGVVVDREPRRVTIHGLSGRMTAPDRLELRVDCTKGTYIRSLVADLGERLGCGAHVESLRRTALGPFRDPVMWRLEDLEECASGGPEALDACLLPPDQALTGHPAVTLASGQAPAFCQGQAAAPATALPAEARGAGPLRVYSEFGAFLGIGRADDGGSVAPRRLLVQRSSGG
ncbi:tRNA pseudouridine(55) synthase TruB [Spiribacter onubensis]|uniref:tRNA pseudouridine synthase B n=1 Tax=Spiribacter onubensis TaxID=3122420 RepID=A0ABV3S9N7_9GAMM